MAGHGTYRTRARIAAALTAGAITFAPAVAGAVARPDFHGLGGCAPDVTHIDFTAGSEAFFAFAVPADCAPQTWDMYFEDLAGNDGKDLPASGRHQIGRATITLPFVDRDTGDVVHEWTQLMPYVGQAPCGAQLDLVLRGDDEPYAANVVEAESCDTPTTTTAAPTTATTSDVRTPPPVTGHADCTAGGLPWFGFRSDTGRGTLHVTFNSPNGPSVMDAAELQPGVWSIVPGVDAGSDRVLDVTGATVDDGSPVELTGAECWRPEGPVSSTSVPAGAVVTPSTTEPATLGFAVDGTQVTLGTAARVSVHGDALPTTGADSGLLAVVAGGLLAGGAALLAHGRRLARRGA